MDQCNDVRWACSLRCFSGPIISQGFKSLTMEHKQNMGYLNRRVGL